jgi:[ribosomal protein S18]-alanine N-acetyltransferase
MTSRIEPLASHAAVPIAILHGRCFPEDPWDADAIDRIMHIPGFFGRVGWVKDDLIGFALAIAVGGETEVVSLGVLPDHRRCGTGFALLDAMCAEASSRGTRRVVLEVALDNKEARALYARRGFTIVGRRRNYYRRTEGLVDALILAVQLPTFPLAT